MSTERHAAKFLTNYMKLREKEDKISVNSLTDSHEMCHHEDSHMTENIILSRVKAPRFYAGTVGKGANQRPVWVHDMKMARPVSADKVHLYEEKLNEEILPLWPYAR